jgi:hypothetical protein
MLMMMRVRYCAMEPAASATHLETRLRSCLATNSCRCFRFRPNSLVQSVQIVVARVEPRSVVVVRNEALCVVEAAEHRATRCPNFFVQLAL